MVCGVLYFPCVLRVPSDIRVTKFRPLCTSGQALCTPGVTTRRASQSFLMETQRYRFGSGGELLHPSRQKHPDVDTRQRAEKEDPHAPVLWV